MHNNTSIIIIFLCFVKKLINLFVFFFSFPPFTGGSGSTPCSLYGFGQGALPSETRGIAGKNCPSKAVAWKGMQNMFGKVSERQ